MFHEWIPFIWAQQGIYSASDFSSAIALAREMAGNASSMAYQVIPPLFCVDMG
jgi:hypothetical protein